jgi:hypothetical protein
MSEDAASKVAISISCPHCKSAHRSSDYSRIQLTQLLENGGPVQCRCPASGATITATKEDRAGIARALGVC